MGTVGSAVVIVVGLLVFGAGVLVAVTEWTPAWLDGTVTRPRLWGAGYALLGLFVVSISHPFLPWGPPSGDIGPALRICPLVIGVTLMWRGRR